MNRRLKPFKETEFASCVVDLLFVSVRLCFHEINNNLMLSRGERACVCFVLSEWDSLWLLSSGSQTRGGKLTREGNWQVICPAYNPVSACLVCKETH